MLEILENYTTFRRDCAFKLLPSTIAALEYALSLVELADKALACLQNVIRNGQPISSRTLQLFVDNLQTSDNSRRRLRAFKLLDKARTNQDISDEAFLRMELARAAFGLSLQTWLSENAKKLMLQFIQDKTEQSCVQLPKDAMLALEKYTGDEATLEILYNVSKNRQILQYNLLSKLMKKLWSTGGNSETLRLIDIFTNVTRNNQVLPEKLLSVLEQAFDSSVEEVHLKALSIFVQRAHKGEPLSNRAVKSILGKISSITDTTFKQEFLSSIGSIVLQLSEEDLQLHKGKC